MNIMQLVDDKISELGDLYKRMDKTRDLVLLAPYQLEDWKGKVEKSISVTRNTPAWQAYVMVNKLLKVKWQVVVESSEKLLATKIADIERFSEDVWAQVDEFLGDKEGMGGGLNAWLADQIVKRGRMGARWWMYYDKEDNLIVDCLPMDMRWCPYELNEWYCNITWRSGASLTREYGDKYKGAASALDIEVRDYWDRDMEEVYINKQKIDERPNIFREPPFVVVLSSAGSTFREKGYVKYEAEDALFLDRELYIEENRIASIAQTLALETIRPAYEQVTKDLPLSTPAVPVPGLGENIRTDTEHIRVPKGDLNNAFLKASQSIEQDIQHGGVTDTEAGNNTDPRSAIWVTTQNELLNEKLKPRIDAMATFKQKSMRLVSRFYVKLLGMKKSAKEVSLGIQGMTHRYSAASLGDPATYRITYIPQMVSKEQNIANTAIANAQRGILPQRFILQDTMQIRDVDKVIREMNMEEARRADPTIGWVEMALSYIEEANELPSNEAEEKNLLSQMLIENVVMTRRQRMVSASPQKLPEAPEVKPNTQGLLALTGPGGNGAKAEMPATVEVK